MAMAAMALQKKNADVFKFTAENSFTSDIREK